MWEGLGSSVRVSEKSGERLRVGNISLLNKVVWIRRERDSEGEDEIETGRGGGERREGVSISNHFIEGFRSVSACCTN